jgi:hypothetical protein
MVAGDLRYKRGFTGQLAQSSQARDGAVSIQRGKL